MRMHRGKRDNTRPELDMPDAYAPQGICGECQLVTSHRWKHEGRELPACSYQHAVNAFGLSPEQLETPPKMVGFHIAESRKGTAVGI